MKRIFGKCMTVLMAALVLLSLGVRVLAAERSDVDRVIASIPPDWPEAPEINARAAILMDADSGEILYALNATESMFPASTTKLMNALLVLENASLEDVVTFSSRAVAIPAGSSHAGMRRGEKMLLRECLYALLLPSANEVANALAEHVAGDQASFVARMNERGKQLGLVNSNFINTNGLHAEGHYTCAYDLALVMKALIENNTFVEISSAQSFVHHSDDLLPKDIPMTNTNMMIRTSSEYYNANVICGKTGHTAESGYNLVAFSESEGTRLISVILGAKENGLQYLMTESLINYGFHSFKSILPAELDTSLDMENRFTPSGLSIPTPEAPLLSISSLDTILLPENVTFDMLTKEVTADEYGIHLTYQYKGYPLGTVSLSYAGEGEDPPFFRADTDADEALPEPLLLIDGWLLLVLALLAGAFAGLTIYLVRRFRPRKAFRSL